MDWTEIKITVDTKDIDNRKLYNHDRNHADFKAELIK